MDVIRGVLSEEEAVQLPMPVFKALANCATDIVVMRVNAYLNNPNASRDAKVKTAEAFSDANKRRAYYGNEDLQVVISKLTDLTYADINVGQEMATLEWWRDAIQDVLTSEYAVAYIAPIRADTIRELCDEMIHSENPLVQAIGSRIIDRYMNLFKDAPFKGYVGTPVKRIISNRSMYEIYLKGLNFAIEKKKSGDKASTWRMM